MKRRKLFSNSSRRKLFSDVEETKIIVCADCGYQIETASSTTRVICPKCGGTRFNVLRYTFSPDHSPEQVPEEKDKNFSRIPLFESPQEFTKRFSEVTNNFELKLKQYSGKTVKGDQVEKIFGVPADSLEERGYAEIMPTGDVNISPTAFLQSKLFSKLIVSVTKIMDLDPDVTIPGPTPEIIDSLGDRGICPKSIILIKKAHGISPDISSDSIASWAKDSGILGDLKLEFGGSSKTPEDFRNIVSSRYPDAPENIIDFLKDRGIIRPIGGRIEIIK